MSGYYGALVATEDRERKINELKKKIIKMYGSSFINFLSYQKPVPVIYRDDSPEIKKAKQEEIQNIIKEREQEYIDREYECLDELNKLILRIRSKNESDPNNNSDFYSASFVPAEAIQQIKCLKCGNKDIENTIRDPIRGDLTCNGVDNQGCGEVLEENTIFSGAEKRNFEGEDERNHHGPAPNKLMPDVVNMETSLFVGVNASSEFKRLTYAHQRLEMDLSKIDKDEKHTRTGYKTRMKKKAFALMEEIGDNLNIHKAVLDQAEEEFAKYRDMKEAVHKFEGTVAACIVIAYEELSKSMKLDDINKSATITSDIALLETSYGHLPSYEEVKDDIAICTIPNINLGKFTIDQAKIWLEAIAQSGNQQKISKHKPTIAQIYIDFQFYGNLLFQYILDEYDKEKEKQSREAMTAAVAESGRSRASSVLSNDSSSNTPMETTTAAASFLEKRKREKEDAFKALFGNTTISHRMQQFQKKPTSLNAANGGGGVSRSDLDNFPGKLILKIVPKEIIKQRLLSPRTPTPTSSQSSTTNNAAVAGTGVVLGGAYDENDVEIVHDYFRQAIQRRSSYDKLVAEKQHEHELEAKRINVEESLAISQRKKIIKVYKQEHEKEKQQQQETVNEDSTTAMEVEGNESKRRKLNEGDDVKNESKTAGNTSQVKAQSKKKEEEDDVKIEFMDDIDLEELIGTSASKLTSVTTNSRPPVAAGGSGPKGILKKAGATTGPMVKNSPGTSSTISVKEEKKEVRVGDANHVPSVKSGSPESTSSIRPVKVEPGAAPSPSSSSNVAPKPTTATAAPPKKVGMKPRPKIVIS